MGTTSWLDPIAHQQFIGAGKSLSESPSVLDRDIFQSGDEALASLEENPLTMASSRRILLTMLDIPIRNRQSERREATRLEILDAAWDIARDKGLANLTLRDVATRIGMRAPSLYSYFASKNDIFDAMFGQSWTDYLAIVDKVEGTLPRSPRKGLKVIAHSYFDYAVADLARNQLMNQRTLPSFVPSAEAYAPAVEVLDRTKKYFATLGIENPGHLDLFVAILGGLVDAQQANDPGGDRWGRLVDEAIDMFADHLGLPGSTRRKS